MSNCASQFGQRIGASTIALLLATLVSAPVHAVDGVKLLSPRATLPLVITKSGSYRLKKNIVVPDLNTTAIEIAASNVTLDLNGFTISGPCTGTPASCLGSGDGIHASVAGVTIRNGTITRMGGSGIAIVSSGLSGRVENMHLVGNGNYGLYTVADLLIENTVMSENRLDGLRSVAYATMVHSEAKFNGGAGVVAVEPSILTENRILFNGADGADCSGGSTLIGNNVTVNGGYGLNFTGGGSGYAHNVIGANTLGDVSGSAVSMGGNVCGGVACP